MGNYHHGNLRNDLIEAGLRLVDEEGLENLSLRRLARMCEVSEAAPYSHFNNKADLLDAMQKYVTDRMMASLAQAYDPNAEEPKGIYDIGAAYIMFSIEHPAYFNFIFSRPTWRIDLSMKAEDDFAPFRFFRDCAFRTYSQLNMDEDSIKYGIIGMWSQVHGIACIASMDNVSKDFDWKDVLDKVILRR